MKNYRAMIMKKETIKTLFFDTYLKKSISACLAIVLLSSCNFDVTNPGAINDDQLNDEGSYEALVNGMGRDLSIAINWIGYTGAAVVREIHPAGATGSFGISVRWQIGILEADETDEHWDYAQRARWVAEDGIERFREHMSSEEFNSSPYVAQSYLWAGYANRLLGENMEQAVINGGSAEPYTVFFERAEEHFTNAITIANAAGESTIASAALAGRASTRISLEKWDEAVADAEGVPDDFEYSISYNALEQTQYNRIFYSTANDPYRAHTVWQTVYEQYYLDYNDPRTPWGEDPEYPVGDAAVGTLGSVPWHFQLKYDSKDSNIRLSSSNEMILIRAEALLMDGNWPEAMALINGIRADVGVDAWPATSLNEAWTRLKRERGIELWLEARRLGDLRRWEENNIPGDLDPLEKANDPSQALPLDANRDLAFPIPNSELNSNRNL